MHHDTTAASSPTPPIQQPPSLQPLAPVRGLGPTPAPLPWAARNEGRLMWFLSALFHAIAVALILLALPSSADHTPTRRPAHLTIVRGGRALQAREVDEDFEEAVVEAVLVSDEPITGAHDGPVVTDDDVITETRFSSDDEIGTSGGAAFEGPASNGTLGVGGGAGGAFVGRGGGRDLGSGGGGRRAHTPTRTWQRSTLAPHTLRLHVGDTEDLPLRGIHATVRVDGFRARVVLDCYFLNDKARTLEGDFQVRLPGDATPSFLAFGEMRLERPLRVAARKAALSTDIDILMRERKQTWNRPREARMVPRTRAAHAYNETVRRMSKPDPALLEWTGAGVFHARVFPLQPGRLHCVVIGYDVDLVPSGDDLLYRLDLPTDVPELLVDLEARQKGATVSPHARGDEGRYRWWNPTARSFEVRVPRHLAQMIEGEDPTTGSYFALRVQPDLPIESQPGSSRAVFALDTSYSSGPAAYPVHLALMSSILAANRKTLTAFALLTFDVQTHWWQKRFVANTPENVAAAVRHARSLTLEGATDVACALAEATAGEGDYDVFLLSDGAPTWGERDPARIAQRLSAGHTLFAYKTGVAQTNDRVLRRLAARTGGGIFAVTSEADLAVAGTAHTHRPWMLESVHVEGGTDLLVAGNPTWVYPGQTLRLVGRGQPGSRAYVRIALRSGNTQRLLRFRPHDVVETPLAPRAYGEVASARLDEAPGVDPDVATAFAAHFRVVGKSCSLLMLENADAYKRFGLLETNHAATVQRTPVGAAARTGGETDGAEAENARAAFLRWLDGLASSHGGSIDLPHGLREALAEVAPARFDVAALPLRCRALRRADASAAYLQALDAHAVTYDGLEREAARRALSLPSRADALRVLSTLVEAYGDDANLLRDVAERAASLGFGGHAYRIWRRVVDRRPDEPHGFAMMGRDLAIADRSELAIVCYEAALTRAANTRYGAFRRSTLFGYVHLLDAIARHATTCALRPWATRRLGGLARELGVAEADLVVTIGWNTDRTDVDLHVFDPTGEHCYYKHRKTKMGGRLTQDVTQGFGPEMFLLREAQPGAYRIAAKYYAADRLRTSGRVAVDVVVYRGWGRPGVTVERRTVVLRTRKDATDIAQVTFGE